MRFEEAQALIKVIRDEDCETTEWEDKFIESILKWRGDLSEKQTACLRKIYEKCTGG